MAAKRNPFEHITSDFYKHHTIEELISQQGAGVNRLEDIRKEFGDLWPDDESIEQFQAFLNEVREPINPSQQEA